MGKLRFLRRKLKVNMINNGYESSGTAASSESEEKVQRLPYIHTQCASVSNVVSESTQTDASSTIRSWKIQRTSKVNVPSYAPGKTPDKHIALLPDGSEVYVMEMQSVGFNVATQTIDNDIFRKSKLEIREIMISWRVLTILLPSVLHLLFYFLNQLLDIIVCVELCQETSSWLCTLSALFLIAPSLFISIFAYEQLIQPDMADVKPMKKKLARILCAFQSTPYYLIGRRVWWSLTAWHLAEHREERLRQASLDLWEKAAQERDSINIKLFQSLLESVPQLSIQSYVLLIELRDPGETTSVVLWISVFVNLFSASSGIAFSQSHSMFEKFAGTFAVFVTLGSRIIICGCIGTLHPGFWLIPVLASFLIGLVTKISESVESSTSGHMKKFQKYSAEAFIMCSACPPFDPTGLFCSTVYVLVAMVFFVEAPTDVLHIVTLLLATIGQVVWVLIGFLLINKSSPFEEDLNQVV